MLVERDREGLTRSWVPTTLEKLGLDEKFLEDTIALAPELLGLKSRPSRLHGPYKAFTQIDLRTPTKRNIHADVCLFTVSGHVILVEVKRFGNPELIDRSVIAQIFDYASTIQSLDEPELCRVFGRSESSNWADLVQSWFPDALEPEDLADRFLQRLESGEVNLVIACDRIPPGVVDVVRGISTQAAIGFELDLVEITPCHRSDDPTGPVMFLPRVRLSTEVVGRTVVTIKFEEGTPQPEVTVVTSTASEIASNLREAKNAVGRAFSEAEVREAFTAAGNPAVLDLLEFCSAQSTNGQIFSPGMKQNASFGFYLPYVDAAGKSRPYMAFTINIANPQLYWYFQRMRHNIRCFPEFETRMEALFGSDVNLSSKQAYQSLQSVAEHMAEFKDLLVWLRDNSLIR